MSDELKTTPGPWRWEIVNGRLELCGGNPKYDVSVMDFVRHGMNGATARFRENVPGMNYMHKAQDHGVAAPGRDHHEWFRLVDHPDAHLIAAAPDLYAALVACQSALAGVVLSQRMGFPNNAQLTIDNDVLPSIEEAGAALAKARGEVQSGN